MVTSPEPSLDPTCGDDGRSVSCALELVARGDVELVEVGRAEVGQGMTLEPCPQELHGVQVRRVWRQERHLDGTIGGVQVLAHELAAMGLQAVPDDQQRPLQVGTQRLEELDVLLLLDRAFVQTERRNRQFVRLSPAMTEMCVQLKWNWMTGVCPLGAQVRTRVGRSLRPDSSMKTISRPSRWAFF